MRCLASVHKGTRPATTWKYVDLLECPAAAAQSATAPIAPPSRLLLSPVQMSAETLFVLIVECSIERLACLLSGQNPLF